MPLKAIFLGSLGTIGETFEIQRRALNAAFCEAGLDHECDPETFRQLADGAYCSTRSIDAYARSKGVEIDAASIYRRKAEIFRSLLGQVRVTPRPGLKKLIEATHAAGLDLALVTTAEPEDVDTMLAAAGLSRETFSFVGDAKLAARPKPAPDIYLAALDFLSLLPQQAIAVEDTPQNTEAAAAAGVQCVAFPGAAHVARGFEAASRKVRTLSPTDFDLPRRHMARRA